MRENQLILICFLDSFVFEWISTYINVTLSTAPWVCKTVFALLDAFYVLICASGPGIKNFN